MEIRTFTSFWNMERKLYAVQDVALPVPVPLRVAGVFLGVGIPWWILLGSLGLSFDTAPLIMLWLAPPVGLGYFATKPIFQGKTIFQFLKSMIAYYLQPKKMFGLRKPSFTTKNDYSLSARVFTRDPKMTKTDKESVTN